MTKYVATIHFETTDNNSAACERLIADAVGGHGLEITDVHVDTQPVEDVDQAAPLPSAEPSGSTPDSASTDWDAVARSLEEKGDITIY